MTAGRPRRTPAPAAHIMAVLKILQSIDGGKSNVAGISTAIKKQHPLTEELYSERKVRNRLQKLQRSGYVYYDRSLAVWRVTNKDANQIGNI